MAVDSQLGQYLAAATEMLALAGIASPRLTAEALLAHVLGVSRTQLLAQSERPLPVEAERHYEELVRRAADGEPLAYLTGTREFHGLEFLVNSHVLVPRPETELLVDEALRFLSDASPEQRVLDVGTGTGCIAVTIAVKCRSASVTALDVSADALTVARENATQHHVMQRMAFCKSDLLSAVRYLPAAFHLLCANLPYIATDELRDLPVARHEPRLALDGGPDGLLWVRRLLMDAPPVMAPGGLLLLEIGATQGSLAAALAQAAFPSAQVAVLKDYAALDRIVRIQI
jgi:release factor glutamine methyltransferase